MNKITEESCVAYIDILGFKEMTKNNTRLREYAKICTYAIKTMKEFNPDTGSVINNSINETRIISLQGADSIFFVFPKDFLYIFLIVSRLRLLQFILAMKGIYIRGAICSGSMYIDEVNKVYFGEAWNEAVSYEQKALYPRILIENKLAGILKTRLSSIGESIMEYIIDDDGSYIIPPCTILGGFEIKSDREYADIYNDVFDALLRNAEKNVDDISILKKLYWISNHIEKEQHREVKNKAKEVSNHILQLIQKE